MWEKVQLSPTMRFRRRTFFEVCHMSFYFELSCLPIDVRLLRLDVMMHPLDVRLHSLEGLIKLHNEDSAPNLI